MKRVRGRRKIDLCKVMCRLLHVPTNLNIDDALLAEAQKVSGARTKRETVNEALREFIRRRKQKGILELFGKLRWDDTYDYKKARSRR